MTRPQASSQPNLNPSDIPNIPKPKCKPAFDSIPSPNSTCPRP